MSAGELGTYLVVFGLLVAAGMGFPIPEELPIITGGALAGQAPPVPQGPLDVTGLLAVAPGGGIAGSLPWAALFRCADPEQVPDTFQVRWWIMLPVCICGVIFSDSLLYGIGRLFGRRLLEHRWLARLLPPDKLTKIEENFHHYGITILLFARFTPGIRAPIFISAGIMRLPLNRFLLADGLYAIPGVTLLFTLAFWFTNSFKELVLRAEANVRFVVIIVVIVGVGIYLLRRFLRKPVPVGDPEELPILGPQVAAHMHAEKDHCPDAQPISQVITGEQPPADGQARREARDAEPHP